MIDQSPHILKAGLITKGRKTGKDHFVWLRAVAYNDKLYFSRRNPDSDWLKNAMADSEVKVRYDDGAVHQGVASIVKDQSLSRKVSAMKYSDEKRSQESRIVLEVTLC